MTEDEYKNIIAQNIRRYREAKGWSQKELALRLGFDNSTRVSNWEVGVSSLSSSTLFAVCEALGVTPSDMSKGENFRPEGMYITEADEVDLVAGYRVATDEVRDNMMYQARRAILAKKGDTETSARSGADS